MHLSTCFLLALMLQCGLIGIADGSSQIQKYRREERILMKVFKTLDTILEDAILSTGKQLDRDIALLKDIIKLNNSNAIGNNIENGSNSKVGTDEKNKLKDEEIVVKPAIKMKGIILRRTLNGKLRPSKTIRFWYPKNNDVLDTNHNGFKSLKNQFKKEIIQKTKPGSKSKFTGQNRLGAMGHSKSSENFGQFGTFTNTNSFKHSNVSPLKESFGSFATSKSSGNGFGKFADFKPNKPKEETFGSFGDLKPSKTQEKTGTFDIGNFGSFGDLKPSKTLEKPEKFDIVGFGNFADIKPVKSPSYGSFKPSMDQPVQTGSSDTMGEFPRGSKHHQAQEDHSQVSFGSSDVNISEGSFGSNTDNCKGIKRRKCSSDSHCSCFGFYKCVKGRCRTRGHKAKAGTTFQSKPDMGTWHEAPKTPMYQTMSGMNPVFN
ncbi:unnamed protein product [Owenia fusiformis]|uniref:Uncharacterized protein n=1 Tax=Owenia fusiformis TaxID=6347 RepID=A0A8S4NQI4_OWEFU|nr:unnamed protein product [Owenia fusiformis]